MGINSCHTSFEQWCEEFDEAKESYQARTTPIVNFIGFEMKKINTKR